MCVGYVCVGCVLYQREWESISTDGMFLQSVRACVRACVCVCMSGVGMYVWVVSISRVSGSQYLLMACFFCLSVSVRVRVRVRVCVIYSSLSFQGH